MNRVHCKDCKWSTTTWNSTGLRFCRFDITRKFSHAEGKTQHAKLCSMLNVDGQCAIYKPRLRKRFWNFVRRGE